MMTLSSLSRNSSLKHRLSFTFIELIIVIAIVAVLASMSLPYLKNTFYSFQLHSFIKKLQWSMNYLRQKSVSEGAVMRLLIDPDNGLYQTGPVSGEEERIVRDHAIPEKITVSSDTSEILFYPDGSIDEATITMQGANDENVVLSTKGVYGTIKIDTKPQGNLPY